MERRFYGVPVLLACELVTEDTVFPEGVIVGLPSDDVRIDVA